MSNSKLLISFTILFLATSLNAASKSNLDKEKRWREQIEPSLMVGDALSLKANGTEFLALFTENTAKQTLGGAIILHGSGVHPAWPDVIEPLRSELAEYGWHTLSLQMPILANEASTQDYEPLFDEVPGRIQAGVEFLKAKGVKNIAIISHSLGNTMASYYLTQQKEPAIKAFVAISFGPGLPDQAKMDSYSHLNKITIPTLDIFGSEDFTRNVNTASKRRLMAKKAGNKKYKQIKIEGADHFFSNMDDILTKRIRGWLKRYATNN